MIDTAPATAVGEQLVKVPMHNRKQGMSSFTSCLNAQITAGGYALRSAESPVRNGQNVLQFAFW